MSKLFPSLRSHAVPRHNLASLCGLSKFQRPRATVVYHFSPFSLLKLHLFSGWGILINPFNSYPTFFYDPSQCNCIGPPIKRSLVPTVRFTILKKKQNHPAHHNSYFLIFNPFITLLCVIPYFLTLVFPFLSLSYPRPPHHYLLFPTCSASDTNTASPPLASTLPYLPSHSNRTGIRNLASPVTLILGPSYLQISPWQSHALHCLLKSFQRFTPSLFNHY